MNDPIEYGVLVNLQQALLGISQTAGYHHDLRVVRLDPNCAVEDLIGAEGVRPFVFIEPKPEAWQIKSMPNGLQLDWPITVHFVHDSDPTDDNSRAKRFFEGCADIETAALIDLTRGGRASRTTITSRQYHAVSGAQVWAMVDLEIRLFRTLGLPNG